MVHTTVSVLLLTIFILYFRAAIGQRCLENQVTSQGNVRLRCKNGYFQPSACIVREQNSEIEVAINSSSQIRGFWVKCEIDDNSIRLSREPRCVVEGREYHVNETVKAGSVVYKCLGTSIEPTGCYFLDSNNKETLVQLGQTVLIENVQHRCRPAGGSFSNSMNNSCIVDNKVYQVGEKWSSGKGFIYECSSDGFITLAECIVEPGVSVKVGQSLVHNRYLHKCTKSGSGIRYTAEPCGLGGVVCPGMSVGSDRSVSSNDSGSRAAECRTADRVYKPGEKFQSSNKGFFFQCSADGSIFISDCIVAPGINVAVGKSLVYEERLHKCEKSGNGGAQYSAEPCSFKNIDCSSVIGGSSDSKISNQTKISDGQAIKAFECRTNSQVYKPGEKFPSPNKSFMYECSATGSLFISDCIVEPGINLAVGKSLAYKDRLHKCEKSGEGGAHYSAQPCTFKNVDCSAADGKFGGAQTTGDRSTTPAGSVGSGRPCVKNGRSHDSGDVWSEKGFKLVCNDGSTSIRACIAEDKTDIQIGGSYSANGLKYSCERRSGGSVGLTTVQCINAADCA